MALDQGAAMPPAAAAAAAASDVPRAGAQVACTFLTPGRTFDELGYLVYVPPGRPDAPLPLVIFLHGADEAFKTRVLVRDRETRRRSMVPDGAWRLRTVPGMMPARADQHPPLPFVLVSPQLPRKVRGFSDVDIQAELRRLCEEHLASRPVSYTHLTLPTKA